MVNNSIRRPDVQQMNASRPRTRGRGGTQNNAGSYSVAPKPVGNGGFFQRVQACQTMVDETYSLAKDSEERVYFTKHVEGALMQFRAKAPEPKPPLLLGICDAIVKARGEEDSEAAMQDVLDVRYVQYGQLELRRTTPIHGRDPPANQFDYVPAENFEMYSVSEKKKGKDAKVHYVQAPRAEVSHAKLHAGSGFDCSHAFMKLVHPLQPSHSPHDTYSPAHVAATLVHPHPASHASLYLLSAQASHALHSGSSPPRTACRARHAESSANILSISRSCISLSSAMRVGHHCLVCP